MKKQLLYPEYKYILATLIQNSKEFTLPAWLIVKELWRGVKFSSESCPSNETISKITTFSEKMVKNSGRDAIFTRFLLKDLKKLTQILGLKHKYTGDTLSLTRIGERSLPMLAREMGLRAQRKINVFCVDNFPKPYDKVKTWDLMFADKNDESKYGITEGIYIHLHRQFPLFCEFLIIHEYVHFIVRSNLKQEESVGHKWIEEGLADWYAFITHFLLFKSMSHLIFFKNLYQIYEKNFPRSPLAEYAQYGRAIKRLYLWGGHKSVKNLIFEYTNNPDSKKWSVLYRNLLQENPKVMPKLYTRKPGDSLDSYLVTLHEKLETLNISAAEFNILKILNKRAKKRMTYDRLRSSLKVESSIVRNAISRLENSGLILKIGNYVSLNDTSSSLLSADAIKPVYHDVK